MNSTSTSTGPARVLIRFGRRLAALAAECDYAQRRMLARQTAPDTYLSGADRAPDSYAEFLFRTSGLLRHEPAAAARSRRRPVG
jgi:hypothetical protein